MIYLDTSALVKLIRIEAESDDLGDWLDARPETQWITTALADVELHRVVRAVAPEALPAAAYPHPLRSLDAILTARPDGPSIDSGPLTSNRGCVLSSLYLVLQLKAHYEGTPRSRAG